MSEADRTAFSPERIKYLEMIQAVIARLASNSFLIKGWTIAATGAFLGFAVSSDQPWLAVPSATITAMFWALDSYYLRSERLFRLLHDRVRQPQRDDYEPFAMNATAKASVDSLGAGDRKHVGRRSAALSGTLLWLYVTLLLAAGVVAAVTAIDGREDSARGECGSHALSRAHERR
jgi:hypothetical protein